MHPDRCSTGVPGLDEILHGGLIARRTYLLVGGAGSGKTILSLQFLLEGLQRGEAGLYLSLAEAGEEIVQNAAVFGWSLDGITLVDLSPSGEPSDAPPAEYHVFPPSDVEREPMWQAIYAAVEAHRPARVVIDSVTQLRYLSTDEYQFRKQLLALVAFLNRRGCTSLLTFEPSEMERDTSVGLAVNGIIRLRTDLSPGRLTDLRTIQVEKMRGTGFMSGRHPLQIADRGMVIYPHYIERPEETQPGEVLIESGLPPMDALLGGGLESGTTTLISGPSGAGKSTLGVQFLSHAVTQGKRAIVYTFEESVNSLVTRSRAVGIPIDEALAGGGLQVVRVNPLELYPDEFLAALRRDVERDHREVVMIDSLRGYHLAMEEFGTVVAHVHNLVTYLNRQAVTTLLINEVEYITGDLRVTELGVSHLADNIILLRYAELRGQVVKVIACLKKRVGRFQPELRQIAITSQGIVVGEKLAAMRGLLTGVPEFEQTEEP